MPYFYKSTLLFLLTAILVSCKNDGDDFTAYFAGKIENPTSRYIIFRKDETILDTIPLDQNNRFFIKFDSLAPGMYSFKHEPDYQYIYFDKNDSLSVTLDTDHFNESIVFRGKGYKKNNFMMELYLENEKEGRDFSDSYDPGIKTFLSRSKSVYESEKAFYKRRKKEIKWSEGFDFYAIARLNLNYYTKKEHYAYLHFFRTGENVRQKLPKNYYNFRQEIDFNNPKLTYFSPFAKYITAMMNNMALAKEQDSNKSVLEQNIRKLYIADSVFTNEKIKNEILDNIAFAYILEDRNIANMEKFLSAYIKLNTEKKDNDIKKMGRAIELLQPGNKIPQVGLINAEGVPYDIDKSTSKQTVVFFWTACTPWHLDMKLQKTRELKTQYPNVNFIAVNVDDAATWKRNLNKFEFNNVLPLHVTDFNTLKFKWVFTKINRTLILNPDGTIKNAFTNLTDDKFDDYLK